MDERRRAHDLHRAGRLDEALDSYRRALAHHRDDAGLRHAYGVCLMQAGQRGAAIELLRGLLADIPGHAPAWVTLAFCLRAEGLATQGREAAARAVHHAPGDPLGWMLLASFENLLGAHAQAVQAARRAVSIAPALAEAWHHLGEALHRQGLWRDAMEAYKRALGAQPGEHFNIALCAERLGDLGLAREHLLKAHSANPKRIDVLGRLCHVQAQLCDFDGEAQSVARLEARLLDPAELDASDRVEAFPLTYLPLSSRARRRALGHYAGAVQRAASRLPRPEPVANTVPPGRVLRLGYISPDLGDHAVGGLIARVFAAHDRARVHVSVYSLRRHEGTVAQVIRAGCDRYRDCANLTAEEIATLIKGDGIEVLIDLGGYTDGARPEVLALRPAPRQLSYLGFIDEQAAPWLDGTVLDEALVPESPAGFPEPVELLATGYFPGVEACDAGSASRGEFGLPVGVPLLVSFNNTYKLDAALLRAWVAILAGCPDAVLGIYLPGVARPGFMTQWHRLGGDGERVLFLEKLPADEHARRAACCDLFLDAFRYQAGATAVAAVASGLPVLGVSGERPVQRLATSLNRFLGLHELVCASEAEYVRKAVGLASDPAALASLRARLIAARETGKFADGARTAAAMEAICAPVA